MEHERTELEQPVRFRKVCARAGMWCLLMIGLLAVCVSLPMMALAF